MSHELLTPSFLFRFSFPLRRTAKRWPECAPLGEEFRAPCFGVLDDARLFADVRLAWLDDGLVFSLRVSGKKHQPWCRDTRLDESDAFHVWIDTRDTKNIHRASRFCHHFVFMPSGGGRRLDQPVADQVLINRARENANPVRPGVLRAQSEKRIDGYALDCWIPSEALTGFDREDYGKLGLFYSVVDREFGEQTAAYSAAFPYREDPSLWCSAELVR